MLCRISFIFFSITFYSFIFALPPLSIGIWIDAELITIAMTGIIAILALLESALFYKKDHFLTPAQKILFIYFLAFIMLAVGITPWVSSKSLHFFGLPQADGLIFYLSFLVMYMACCGLLNKGYDKAMITTVTIAAALIISFVVLNNPIYHIKLNPKWSIYVFSAFIGLIGLCVTAMTLRAESKEWKWFLMFFGIGIIAISFNKTAILGLVIASYVFPYVRLYKDSIGKAWGYLTVAISPFLFIAATVILAKTNPVVFESLDNRYKQLLVIFFEFCDHPLHLINGFGFGHFTDGLLHQLVQVGSGFYENGVWKPTWTGIDRIDFNAQHYIVDALSACGILGGLWAWVFPLLLLWLAPKKHFNFTVFICFIWICIASTWFILYLHLPFMALLCALIATSSDKDFKIPCSPKLVIGFLIASCISLSYASYHLYQTTKLFTLMDSWLGRIVKKDKSLTKENLIKYGAAENSHLATYIQSTLDYLASQPFDEKVQEELKLLLTVSLQAKQPSALLRVVTLNVLDYLVNARREPSFEKTWEQYLNETLNALPKRHDLVASYISYLIYKHRKNEAEKWLNKIDENNTNSPISMWFKGIIMTENLSTKDQGVMLLRKAVEAGVGRLVPIEPHFLMLINLSTEMAD